MRRLFLAVSRLRPPLLPCVPQTVSEEARVTFRFYGPICPVSPWEDDRGPGWENEALPGHTKCLLYASSSFGAAFFEKRSRFLGPFPQRLYVVKEGISLRSWAWNRKIRRMR